MSDQIVVLAKGGAVAIPEPSALALLGLGGLVRPGTAGGASLVGWEQVKSFSPATG